MKRWLKRDEASGQESNKRQQPSATLDYRRLSFNSFVHPGLSIHPFIHPFIPSPDPSIHPSIHHPFTQRIPFRCPPPWSPIVATPPAPTPPNPPAEVPRPTSNRIVLSPHSIPIPTAFTPTRIPSTPLSPDRPTQTLPLPIRTHPSRHPSSSSSGLNRVRRLTSRPTRRRPSPISNATFSNNSISTSNLPRTNYRCHYTSSSRHLNSHTMAMSKAEPSPNAPDTTPSIRLSSAKDRLVAVALTTTMMKKTTRARM